MYEKSARRGSVGVPAEVTEGVDPRGEDGDPAVLALTAPRAARARAESPLGAAVQRVPRVE